VSKLLRRTGAHSRCFLVAGLVFALAMAVAVPAFGATAKGVSIRVEGAYGTIFNSVRDVSNTVVTDSDATGHAETNLVRLATKNYSLEQLRTFTLYTSCEPCAMCSGALYWAGVHRLVYAASQQDIADSMGGDLLPMPSCDVLAGASRRVRVDAGPGRDRATQVLRRYR